uniref:endonuclease/exonuclease/phosphatase family protein n=1 Tax=Thaumasiovibrio occultus TaxID=1891184 RepID=UPI000B350D97|nr:endonuclease/exonuclease/phosphatase family protein [Thaumasiovibrio occultus]
MTLKFATWNLLNFLAPPFAAYEMENIATHAQWEKKCRWISMMLAAIDADVVGFQEVFSQQALTQLCQDAGLTYFATVDQPQCQDGHVCSHPVVALASRYPIVKVETVTEEAEILNAIGMSADFHFHRTPVVATIVLPLLGETKVFVVHLKSQRSLNDELAPVAGQWGATLHRGTEAMLLANAVNNETMPVVVMGDFNQGLDGDSLRSLREQCGLTDSWQLFQRSTALELAENDTQAAHIQSANEVTVLPEIGPRPATFYYGNQGLMLDYILFSRHFDPKCQTSMVDIAQYQCWDRHLVSPQFDIDGSSTDHAIVTTSFVERC